MLAGQRQARRRLALSPLIASQASVRKYSMNGHIRVDTLSIAWFVYLMVAYLTKRTFAVNQEFRFFKGIWLHRKSLKIQYYYYYSTMIYSFT